VIPLALGLAALALLLGAARGFSQASVANVKTFLAWLAVLGGLVAMTLLLLTGRVLAAVAVLAFVGPLAWTWRQEGRQKAGSRASRKTPGPMTRQEAAEILGVPINARRAEVQAAWKRCMRTAHPDHGGSAADASRVNQARDRLLGRHMDK
jgi:hypothetical protein